jgi:hypothetical protein
LDKALVFVEGMTGALDQRGNSFLPVECTAIDFFALLGKEFLDVLNPSAVELFFIPLMNHIRSIHRDS